MTFAVTIDILTGEFEKRMAGMELPIAQTTTRTMDEVAGQLKTQGRSDIARAGFSRRWQNTFRVNRYPTGGKISIDAAVYAYHKIVYAGIFDDGGRIQGNPLLWKPLEGTPPRIGRNRMTPRNFGNLIGPLVSFQSRGGNPLLGATIRVNRTQANEDRPKVTLAALRRGKSGKGVLRTIPLFIGIRAANIPKKFGIAEISQDLRDRLPQIYAAKFNAGDYGG